MKTLEEPRKLIMETVQWSTLDHIDEVEPISDRDIKVLEEIKEVIDRHAYHNRFGISLLHRHFDVFEGEVALETTDEVARTSIVSVVNDDRDDNNRIRTQWRFKKEDKSPAAITVCEQFCYKNFGHTRRHKKVGR